LRNDNDDGLANRFIGGVAEDTRRPPVPTCDDAIEVLCEAQLWIGRIPESRGNRPGGETRDRPARGESSFE
jgi:hypothetical protein